MNKLDQMKFHPHKKALLIYVSVNPSDIKQWLLSSNYCVSFSGAGESGKSTIVKQMK